MRMRWKEIRRDGPDVAGWHLAATEAKELPNMLVTHLIQLAPVLLQPRRLQGRLKHTPWGARLFCCLDLRALLHWFRVGGMQCDEPYHC